MDGQPAKILFQGRVPGLAGLDQFNIEIPAGITGCYVTVWFQTGNILSNLTTISVAPGPSCPDPMVSSSGPSTGTLKVAGLQLVRSSQKLAVPTGPVDLTIDSSAAAFSVTDLSTLPTGGNPSPLTVIGGCIVGPIVNQVPGPDTGAVSYLSAGPSITLRGPNGVKQLEKFPTGYGAQLGSTPFPGQVPVPPPPYLSPGVYTMDNGAGTADVPPFSVSITLPDPSFAWSNADQVSLVQRTQGMEITWTGGDATGYVDIAGSSRLPRTASPVMAGGLFSCRVPASAGRFRIPAQILLYLPPTVTTAGVPSGTVSVVNTLKTVSFNLPGFQFADMNFVSSITRSVEFR